MSPVCDPGKVLILGAGPTGLGVAHRLFELGFDAFQLLETQDGPGGLAGSVLDDRGYTWDLGGHVQFSHYDYYDNVLDAALGDAWLWHQRESWVWIRSRFVPYPFQHNIHRLDPADREKVIDGLVQAHSRRDQHPRPAHFQAWIDACFGAGMSEIFLTPYNFKVWGYPLDQLSAGWVGERVAVPELGRIRQNIASGRDDVSWGPNHRFRFPTRGGTGAIWKAVAGRLPQDHLTFGAHATSISAADRCVTLADGRQVHYDVLVSTVPLDTLACLVDGIPPQLRAAAASLRYSAVHVVGVGLTGDRPQELDTKCWMYFPESHSPYFRITVFSNYSPHNVPPGCGAWSLMAEVCETAHRPVLQETIVEEVVAAMRTDRLIPQAASIASLWHRRLDHGYPTPTVGRDEALDVLLPFLEQMGIYSRGRFGAWKYEVSNQDHSFMQGVELADRLLHGSRETTLTDASRVNSGIFLRGGQP
jgi:protoporphyrinogen oxidase